MVYYGIYMRFTISYSPVIIIYATYFYFFF